MKIAILFRGISHGHGKADFRQCADNIKENLIEPLKENHEVSTYICTYDNPYIGELVETYSPTKLEIIPYQGTDQITTFIHCMEMMKTEDIDFIFVTRFDTKFLYKVTEFGVIDFDKINFMYPPHDPFLEVEFVSDLAIWLNKKHIDSMIQGCHYLQSKPPRPEYPSCMHGIYKALKHYTHPLNIHFTTYIGKPLLIELIR
jgi:hypothetical protein